MPSLAGRLLEVVAYYSTVYTKLDQNLASLAYRNWRDVSHALNVYSWEKSI